MVSALEFAAPHMRILSGIQSSGKQHIGNYYGALRQFVDLQNRATRRSTSSPTSTR